MINTPIIINNENHLRLKALLAHLCAASAARVVILVDRDGQPIAYHGDLGDIDNTSFSSLAAGNVAATAGMARQLGEEGFPSIIHEGERTSIFISVIANSLLAVVFDRRSTLGLVKIRTKRASFEVAKVLEEIAKDSANQTLEETSFFANVTDDEINRLFS